MSTIQYYDAHAQSFYERTIDANLSNIYTIFLPHLPAHAHILDAGCGVGRDTKYFLSQGYRVTAIDASQAMVDLACKETKNAVIKLNFEHMTFAQEFDAVWAQLSLIHVPYTATRSIIEKIHHALKPNGIFYASYKYGVAAMPTPERNFYNMTEETIKPYLAGLFEIVQIWKEADTRSKVSPSKDAALLHVIARKL